MKRVEIRVKGQIDPEWSDWFDGLVITHETQGETTMAGDLTDQSALYGLLSKLRDLGLELVSVKSSNELQEV